MRVATAALTAVALLLACTIGGVRTLHDSDNAKTVTLSPGQHLRVELNANQSTPYQWVVRTAPDPAVLTPTGDPTYIPGNTDRVGAPGHEVFEFQAVASGTTAIELRYERISPEGQSLSTWSVTVTVR